MNIGKAISQYFWPAIEPAPTSNSDAELYFERDYHRQDTWDQADAILAHVLKIPESRVIWVVGNLEIVKNDTEFEIAPEIRFRLVETQSDNKGVLNHVAFKLTSKSLSICDLRSYVNKLTEEYLINKKNNLGEKIFYFDHIVEKVNSRMPVPTSPKVLFSKHLFCTNRTLDNVFHERQQELKQRVEFFLTRKDWYDKRGIPHTFGLMLYGVPGGGKTTTIKAIANMAKRHIVNINFGAIKTKKQLKKLFYDEKLEICENMNNTANVSEYIIPIEKRLYVIEDIDAIDSDLVLRRNRQETHTIIEQQPDENQDLDLSTILNIIDGTLETPGRMLVVTSNYPEKLDEALIRPGRIDMLLEYKKCNRAMLRDMFVSFFEREPDPGAIAKIPEYTWTPAEVCQLLFKNFGNPDNALTELVRIDPGEYFKFSHVKREVPEKLNQDIKFEVQDVNLSLSEQLSEERTQSMVDMMSEGDLAKYLDEFNKRHEHKELLNTYNSDPNSRGFALAETEQMNGKEESGDLGNLLRQEREDYIADNHLHLPENTLQTDSHGQNFQLLNSYTGSDSGYAFAEL